MSYMRDKPIGDRYACTTLHSTPGRNIPRRNIGIPFGTGKLEWCGYPVVIKVWGYV